MLRVLWRFVAITLCTSGSPAQAQVVHVEGRAGLTRSTLASPEWTPGWRNGTLGAAGVDVELRRWLALRGELVVMEAGASGPTPFRMNQLYLAAPILVRLGVPRPLLGITPYVLGGTVAATELRCGGTSAVMTPALVGVPSDQVTALDCAWIRTARQDWGGLLGAGAYIGTGRLRWSIEARGSRGRQNLTHDFAFIPPTRSRATSMTLGASWRVR